MHAIQKDVPLNQDAALMLDRQSFRPTEPMLLVKKVCSGLSVAAYKKVKYPNLQLSRHVSVSANYVHPGGHNWLLLALE